MRIGRFFSVAVLVTIEIACSNITVAGAVGDAGWPVLLFGRAIC
jgi:hypothetical protein